MNNVNVSTRLCIGFGFVLTLLLVMAVVGITKISLIDEVFNKVVKDRYPKTVMANAVIDALNVTARAMRNTLLVADQGEVNKELARIRDSKQLIDTTIDRLGKISNSEKGKRLVNAVANSRDKYLVSQEKFMQLQADGKVDEAKVLLLGDIRTTQRKLFDDLDALNAFQSGEMDAAEKEGEEAYRSARFSIILLASLAVLSGIAITVLVTRSIALPLAKAVHVAKLITTGDLRNTIDNSATDEIGQLLIALKEMNASLTNIVGKVRSGSDAILTASNQIASGNLDLSARTEEQASALEETASSMEELTSTVKQNSQNAQQANMLADTASTVAQQGGDVVAQVVEMMESINDSSRKIVDIIAVIDGIAFQTNILALNAAVEAARAGEQGRGFAVVAAEVRNLAQRSATAAKEIKALIGDSVEKVDAGTRLVGQAGATMNDVVASVKRVTQIINDMTVAGNEQTSGIEQVNQAIMQIDDVTQQNAALVEEAAAAAQSMQQQSQDLSRTVSIFKLAEA